VETYLYCGKIQRICVWEIKVSRAIADLSGLEIILAEHILRGNAVPQPRPLLILETVYAFKMGVGRLNAKRRKATSERLKLKED
jgi:hypothetical protein